MQRAKANSPNTNPTHSETQLFSPVFVRLPNDFAKLHVSECLLAAHFGFERFGEFAATMKVQSSLFLSLLLFIIMSFPGKRVGVRQRLGMPDTTAASTVSSEHGKALVEAYAKGKLAASDIGHLARSAAASSSDVPSDVSLFSSAAPKAGTANPAKNSSRNLKRSLGSMNDSFDVEPYLVEMPFWDSKAGKQVTDTTACLLIHEMLDELVAAGSEHEWADVTDPSQEGLRVDLRAWKDRVHLSTVLPVILLALWDGLLAQGIRFAF